ITTSDPKKVPLSTDPAKRGSASLKTSKPVYLQALAESGTVTISVSAPGYGNSSGVYTLVPTGFAISIVLNNGVVLGPNRMYTTTTQSPALSVQLNLNQPYGLAGSAQLIPGLAPLKISVTASNPGVALIQGGSLLIPADPAQQFPSFPSPTVLQVASGETTINISQPAGFTSV